MKEEPHRIAPGAAADADSNAQLETIETVDDRKGIEQMLQDQERELLRLVDMVPSHLWRLSPDGEVLFINKRMLDFLGLDLKDTEKPAMTRLAALLEASVHPDDAPAFAEALRRCLATGDQFSMRYRLRRADGVYLWMSSRAQAMRDEAGRIVQWYGVCHDIDDQVQTEHALRQSKQQLQQMIDEVPVRIWSVVPGGGPAYLNKRYQDHLRSILGSPIQGSREPVEEPSIERLLQLLVHPEDAPGVRLTLGNCFESGAPSQLRFRWREQGGGYRWAECRVAPRRDHEGAIVQWYGVSLDIDDEVRAQEALRNREQELSHVVDMVPSYLWRLTPEGEPNFFNKRLLEFLGPATANAHNPGMSRMAAMIDAAIHPDDAASLAAALNHSLATSEPFSMRYRMRRADGVYRWVEGRAEPMQEPGGRIVQWYGLAHDIDDQLRAEDVLRKSEQSLQQLIDAVPINIWSFTAAGKLAYVSKRYMRHLNIPDASFADFEKVVRELVHPEDAPETYRIAANGFQTGTAFVSRYRRRERDGSYRWCEARAEPLRDQDGRVLHWYAVSIDVDDEKRAQEALRQAFDKLATATRAASLAELSASIAHEVNQPLAAIIARSHACQRWLSLEPPNIERAKVTAEGMIRDANSAADVVSRIRALFRQAQYVRSPEDVNHLVREVCRLMADEIAGNDMRVELRLAPDLPSVALDRVQVQQVLVNLIRNGIEAMAGVTDRARALEIRSCSGGIDAIRIEVRDSGTGISDTARVFEPFFTTKQHGMGMGLAICRSIVESHGGKLWAANNETCGALVAFTLPLTPNQPP
jgi:PAS domain S-box-containing protein